MTTTEEISTELSLLIKGMLAKGFRQPEARYTINADAQSYLYVAWVPVGSHHRTYSGDSVSFDGKTFEESHAKALEWLDKQPTPEQRRFREFAEILAKAVEVGKQNGIDAVLVNPLERAMRDLSKNALMFQPEAA